MKLIQILVVAASLAVSAAAQTGGQNSDATTPPASKQQPSSAQNSADSQKKSSAKPQAATRKTGDHSTPTGPIKVIPIPASTGGKTTAPVSAVKNGSKAATPTPSKTPATTGKSTPATSSVPSAAAQKTPVTTTTGKTTPATGAASSTGTSGKAALSSKPGNQPATGQSKQTVPVIPVGPASKQTAGKPTTGKPTAASQTAGKQAASQPPANKQPATKQAATQAKGTDKNAPIVIKSPSQPKVTIKKPSKEELVAASKISSKISSGGRRDPFVSPVRTVTPQAPIGPNCSTGKRCLAINELTVKGTAKDTDGRMMAIVASSNSRAYFLRENDQVFNGTVQKITSDSVVFRESVVDSLGRQSTHEIVKRINPS